MDFAMTDEQDQFRKSVRSFAEEMGKLGLFGLLFPEEYGGGGADFTTLCIAIEETARVDSSMAITLEAGVGSRSDGLNVLGLTRQMTVLRFETKESRVGADLHITHVVAANS